jgi:hypothetical protein
MNKTNLDFLKDTNPKEALGICKIPLHTVPCEVLMELGLAMLEGGRKYGTHNYREMGVRMSTYYDACQRHLMSWWEGEDYDPDSGIHHIIKAMACLLVVRDSMHMGNVVDDRPTQLPLKLDIKTLNSRAKKIIEKYPECEVPYTQEKINDLPKFPNLTQMDHPTACKYLKPRMRVKLLQKSDGHVRGWSEVWVGNMDQYVGKIYTISKVKKNMGITLVEDTLKWNFPAFCFEIIKDRKLKVYFSHRIRGKSGENATIEEINKNRQDAMEVCSKIRETFPQLDIYCPAEADEIVTLMYNNKTITEKDMLDADCEILGKRDLVIAYCKDGYKSRGMNVELGYAQRNGIPTFEFCIWDDNVSASLTSFLESFNE